MKYFILFSIALIVMSVIILVSPLNHRMNVMPIQEGFGPESTQPKSKSKSKYKSKSK